MISPHALPLLPYRAIPSFTNKNDTPVRGGGVAAFIKNNLNFKTIKIFIKKHVTETEYIIFEVYPRNIPLITY